MSKPLHPNEEAKQKLGTFLGGGLTLSSFDAVNKEVDFESTDPDRYVQRWGHCLFVQNKWIWGKHPYPDAFELPIIEDDYRFNHNFSKSPLFEECTACGDHYTSLKVPQLISFHAGRRQLNSDQVLSFYKMCSDLGMPIEYLGIRGDMHFIFLPAFDVKVQKPLYLMRLQLARVPFLIPFKDLIPLFFEVYKETQKFFLSLNVATILTVNVYKHGVLSVYKEVYFSPRLWTFSTYKSEPALFTFKTDAELVEDLSTTTERLTNTLFSPVVVPSLGYTAVLEEFRGRVQTINNFAPSMRFKLIYNKVKDYEKALKQFYLYAVLSRFKSKKMSIIQSYFLGANKQTYQTFNSLINEPIAQTD